MAENKEAFDSAFHAEILRPYTKIFQDVHQNFISKKSFWYLW